MRVHHVLSMTSFIVKQIPTFIRYITESHKKEKRTDQRIFSLETQKKIKKEILHGCSSSLLSREGPSLPAIQILPLLMLDSSTTGREGILGLVTFLARDPDTTNETFK